MQLYEVAAITKLTQKEKDEGATPQIEMMPKCIIANNETSAILKLVQDGSLAGDFDQLQVLVRPF